MRTPPFRMCQDGRPQAAPETARDAGRTNRRAPGPGDTGGTLAVHACCRVGDHGQCSRWVWPVRPSSRFSGGQQGAFTAERPQTQLHLGVVLKNLGPAPPPPRQGAPASSRAAHLPSQAHRSAPGQPQSDNTCAGLCLSSEVACTGAAREVSDGATPRFPCESLHVTQKVEVNEAGLEPTVHSWPGCTGDAPRTVSYDKWKSVCCRRAGSWKVQGPASISGHQGLSPPADFP